MRLQLRRRGRSLPNGGVSNYKTFRDIVGPRWGTAGYYFNRQPIIVKLQFLASITKPDLIEQFIPIIAAARFVARFANQNFNLFGVELKCRSCAADDVFFHHHAPKIVRAKF